MTEREDVIQNAIRFLRDEKVRQAPLEKRIAFLESKGLSKEEIQKSLIQSDTQTPPLPLKQNHKNQAWKSYAFGAVCLAGVAYGIKYLDFYLRQFYEKQDNNLNLKLNETLCELNASILELKNAQKECQNTSQRLDLQELKEMLNNVF